MLSTISSALKSNPSKLIEDHSHPSLKRPMTTSHFKESSPLNATNQPVEEYSHEVFFGAPHLNKDQLGREMLHSVVTNKTDWVPKALLPQDKVISRFFHYVISFFKIRPNINHLNHKSESKLWRQVGELSFAKMLGDHQMITLAERKTDHLFHNFMAELENDQKLPEYCFAKSIECHANPEAFFDLAKLNYLTHNYTKAIELFKDAELYSKNLEASSSYRIKVFQALMKKCSGAAQERLGFHDKALFNYIDAANIDPQGRKGYEECLSRNFQILKFKPNKCDEELEACMEYDPYEPDFVIESANSRLNQGQVEVAIQLLNKANLLSFKYKHSALYKCVELAQQIAFCVNNTQVHSR